MKNSIVKVFTATIVLLSISLSNTNLLAQEVTSPKTRFSVEIDPVTFGFEGYSFHLRVSPAKTPKLLFGAGIYAMDLPSMMVESTPDNQDWKARIDLGYGLFAEHYFSEINKKWFVGAQTSIQQYKVEDQLNGEKASYTSSLLMAYGGYSWQPFDFGLYIKPWAGLGYSSKIAGTTTTSAEGRTYQTTPITVFGTLHIGYTF